MRTTYYKLYRLLYDENDDDGSGKGGDGEGGETEIKTFTQEDIDQILDQERKKFSEEKRQMVRSLETLRDKSDLTVQEKKELAQQIEQLRQETETTKQLSQKEIDKLHKTHASALQKAKDETDLWRHRFEQELISTAILQAANQYEAFDPAQIIAVIKLQNPEIVEDLDSDGTRTGKFTPKVTVVDKDKDGRDTKLVLSIADAVKRMSETESHFNLFKPTAKSGLGFGGSEIRTKPGDVPKNPNDYREWRKKSGFAKPQ